MYVLVVARIGSSMPPVAYGPFDSEDDAEREWERQEGMRFLFDDLLAHHVLPLQASAPKPVTPAPPALVIHDHHHYLPYASPCIHPWIYYNQQYPYRVTWSNGTYTVNGAIAS